MVDYFGILNRCSGWLRLAQAQAVADGGWTVGDGRWPWAVGAVASVKWSWSKAEALPKLQGKDDKLGMLAACG